MSNLRTCDHCGELFETITRRRLHQEDCDDQADDPIAPDYRDPFSPDRDGDREMRCLHCGATFNEAEIVYEKRVHSPHALWYCPMEGCDGSGVGFDLFPA